MFFFMYNKRYIFKCLIILLNSDLKCVNKPFILLKTLVVGLIIKYNIYCSYISDLFNKNFKRHLKN